MVKTAMAKEDRQQARRNFAKSIKNFMQKHRLSKREFAKLAGTTRPTLDNVLDGKGNIETYQKIGEYIGEKVL